MCSRVGPSAVWKNSAWLGHCVHCHHSLGRRLSALQRALESHPGGGGGGGTEICNSSVRPIHAECSPGPACRQSPHHRAAGPNRRPYRKIGSSEPDSIAGFARRRRRCWQQSDATRNVEQSEPNSAPADGHVNAGCVTGHRFGRLLVTGHRYSVGANSW